MPNFTFIRATCRGEKHIFGPLSKNNTDMAALRAGLPVKKLQINMHHLREAMQYRQAP